MNKIKELLIYPLIVGLIVAFFAFVLPLLIQKNKRLEYEIEQPVSYLQPDKVGNLQIKINGLDTKQLNAYTVRLKNTGDIPIKDLEVLYKFTNPAPDFRILTEYHKTQPALQFGKIAKSWTDSISETFVYGLFNPGDEATLTILTSKNATLNVFAKQEELSFSRMEIESWWKRNSNYLQIIVIGMSVIASFLTKSLESISLIKSIFLKT